MKNYTAKKIFIELTKETFSLLFALQTEHYIFTNISRFKSMLSDVASSMNIEVEFAELVFDKYYFSAIREIEEKKEKTSDLHEYVEVDNFEVLNRHVEEALETYLEDLKEYKESRPGYDFI